MDNPKLTPLARFLKKQHRVFSWSQIVQQIAAVTHESINRGLLSAIARGKRQPTNHQVDLINRMYGTHFKHRVVLARVETCPRCGIVHPRRKTCPTQLHPSKQRAPLFREIWQRANASIYKES